MRIHRWCRQIWLRLSVWLLLSILSYPAIAQTGQPVSLKTPNLTLEGTLTLPANANRPVPVVLIIPGSGPTDRDGNNPIPAGQPNSVQASSYKLLADSLARLGVAVVRFDKRGVGRSASMTMSEAQLRFEDYVQDAVGWVGQLRSDKRFSGVTVLGHSEGSLIGMVAARQAKANGFISVAGPGDNIADKLKTQLGPQLPEAARQEVFQALDSLKAGHPLGRLPTSYPAVRQLFRPSVQPYLMSWMAYDPVREIKLLTMPVLIIQGRRDVQVKVADAERLKSGSPSATLRIFDAMTHALKDAGSDSFADSLKTYTDPSQPLTPGLAATIAQFVK